MQQSGHVAAFVQLMDDALDSVGQPPLESNCYFDRGIEDSVDAVSYSLVKEGAPDYEFTFSEHGLKIFFIVDDLHWVSRRDLKKSRIEAVQSLARLLQSQIELDWRSDGKRGFEMRMINSGQSMALTRFNVDPPQDWQPKTYQPAF